MDNRNLLSHSSGFCYDAIDEKLQKWAAFVGREINAQSRTLDGIRYPLIFEPGESWQYGVGIDWAGQVIEALTNQTLGKYMQRNVFDPLGMSSTTFRISDRPDLAQRRAALGFRSSRDSPLGPGPDPAPINPEIEMGGGGIFTSANDYGKLLGALISGDERILKLETVKELMTPQLKDPKPLQEYCDSPMHEMITPEFPKGLPVNATLGGAVNLEDVPGKRRKGSMMWSGLTNPRCKRLPLYKHMHSFTFLIR